MKRAINLLGVFLLLLAASNLPAETTKNSSVEVSRQRMEQQQAQIKFRQIENEYRQQMQTLRRWQEKRESDRIIEKAQRQISGADR